LPLPDKDCVVELLCDGESSQVPGVTAVVDVLWVAANGDGLACANVPVDPVEAKGVDDSPEIRESPITAGLKGGVVTP
jgi:hypothetical protein